ncbi:MAG TPA: prepilin-type N-terminal cleavage/methylation domain-containing protein [Chthonomonadaceae bacterium]|nr:prepilin-type N-terminal cleavage/methylation domain-containing protein [Chthonomonadaceae bacterium]
MKRNAAPSRPVRKGFSLVELLAVILCIALLISLAFPLYNSAVTRYDNATCRAGMPDSTNAVCSYGVPSTFTHRQLARSRP